MHFVWRFSSREKERCKRRKKKKNDREKGEKFSIKEKVPFYLSNRFSVRIPPTQPTVVRVCKMEAQLEHVHVFCTFGADFCAQSVLINKISTTGLSRKFVTSALLVGYDRGGGGGVQECFFPPPFPLFIPIGG